MASLTGGGEEAASPMSLGQPIPWGEGGGPCSSWSGQAT